MSGLADILLKEKLIEEKDLNAAMEQQKKTSQPLGKVVIEMGLVREEALLKAIASQTQIEFYPKISDNSVSEEAIKKVPIKLVSLYKFLPLSFVNNVLVAAVSDPFNMWLVQGIKKELKCELRRVLSTEAEIEKAINKYYGIGAETIDRLMVDKPLKEEDTFSKSMVEDVTKSAQAASVINLVNQIMGEAVTNRATDIHLESYRGAVRVRQRVDGVLYSMKLPEETRHLYPEIVSRIKIISGLDVIEKRLPQDGRAKIKVKGEEVDLRISVLPSGAGENVVIRILPTKMLFDLSDLGFLPEDKSKLGEIIKKPHGIIFLTGPTGSGKTTTLYASLKEINSEKIKIITIEDPVEYELKDITQIQVNPKIGLSFAAALRSILRHDPDVIMVGEVRDPETAELAIRSSLTGHLVFSTLHTNDAASGIARLLDMGIEPYLAASSVEVFISQRLARIICPHCKQKIEASDRQKEYGVEKFIYEGKGCQECSFTGFFGRTVIYEMLVMNEEIRELILKRATSEQINRKAKELGFKSLKENGLEKVNMGVTTLDEIMRIVEL